MSSPRRDHEWLISARGWWFISRHAGIDLALLRSQRDTSGPPDVSVDETNHRLVTRAVLRIGRLWDAFDVGWEVDPVGKPCGGGAIFSSIPELICAADNSSTSALKRDITSPATSVPLCVSARSAADVSDVTIA